MKRQTAVLLIMLIAIALLSGCTGFTDKLVREANLTVEKVSSRQGVITYANVTQEADQVVISGQVRHWPFGRGHIPGCIDIEVRDSSESTLEKRRTEHHRHNRRSWYTKFYTRLNITPPPGSIIWVAHHEIGYCGIL